MLFFNFCLSFIIKNDKQQNHIDLNTPRTFSSPKLLKPSNVKITHKLISITILHRTQTILPIVLTRKLVISTEASRPVGNNKWTSNGGEFLRNVTELRPKANLSSGPSQDRSFRKWYVTYDGNWSTMECYCCCKNANGSFCSRIFFGIWLMVDYCVSWLDVICFKLPDML